VGRRRIAIRVATLEGGDHHAVRANFRTCNVGQVEEAILTVVIRAFLQNAPFSSPCCPGPERRETSSANPKVIQNRKGTCPKSILLPLQIVRVSQQS
jgi:hypothetical protein